MPSVPYDALARVCGRYQVRELAIFGPAVSGHLRPDSDIDLLVVFDGGARIGLVALARLRNEMVEAADAIDGHIGGRDREALLTDRTARG